MGKKSTEVPSNGKALATTTPRALARQGTKIGGKGFENLEREDLILPRIKLLQPLNPEVAEQGEKPGSLFLNLSNKSLGKEITVTPILHFRSRVKWNPKDDGGGIDCSSNDAKIPRESKYAEACVNCSHKDWNNEAKKKEDQAPKCTLYENFVVLIGDETSPVILPMEKTKSKVAKKFYSMMALKGGDMFDWTYKLGSLQEKNDKGQTYFNYQVTDIGKKVEAKRRDICDKIWAALQKATITSEVEHPEDEVVNEKQAGKF